MRAAAAAQTSITLLPALLKGVGWQVSECRLEMQAGSQMRPLLCMDVDDPETRLSARDMYM